MDVTFLLVVVGGLFILGLVALVIVGVILFIVLGRNHLHLRSADKSSTGSPGTEFPMSGHDPAAPINPASGLPMVGGVDTAGNPFGASATPQINPATGLPMVGGVDAAGNPFGTSHP